MHIVGLPAFNDNYIWVILHAQMVTCIDPGDAQPVLDYVQQHRLVLSTILLTHHHSDHVGGVPALVRAFPQAVVYAPWDKRILFATRPVADQNLVAVKGATFRVLATPGHTASHVCYHESAKGWLFCGDTLFSAGCGRVFDGSVEQLHHSLHRLGNLPTQTQVYCGHEYTLHNLRFANKIEPHNAMIHAHIHRLRQQPNQCSLPSTLGLEHQINPFLRTHTPALKKFAQHHGIDPLDSFALFKQLRGLKDVFQ